MAGRQRQGKALRRLHLCLVVAWALTLVPTVLWWHDSVLWVAIMSVYAIVVGHWSAYQGSRAETENGAD